MTARVGTPSFTTEESKASENKQKLCVKDVIDSQNYWSLGKSGISITSNCESVGNKNIYGKWAPETKSGKVQDKSSFMIADGGDIVCNQDGKMIHYGVVENKWQFNIENVIERCWRYLVSLLLQNIWPFYVFDGPGFNKETMLATSSSTGSTYENMKSLEKKSNGLIKVLLCPEPKEAEEEFKAWLDRLKEFSKMSKEEQYNIRCQILATFKLAEYEGTLLGSSLMLFMMGNIE